MTNSPIPRIGGKRLLRKKICELFPEPARYNRYIEVFGGGGWVLLAKDRHAALEVYNDADGELVNLLRCIKYHCSELQKEINGYYNSREMFFDALEQLKMHGLTDIQRAARYYIKMRLSYGANGREFSCSKKPLNSSKEYLQTISERLQSVVIEHKDFENLIKTYDRPTALFYCDPPYFGSEKYYEIGFTIDDHNRLKRTLNSVKGMFILSYNDTPLVREMYKDYNITLVSRSNNLSAGSYKELIIRNF